MGEIGRIIKHFSHEHNLKFSGSIRVGHSCFICNRSFGGQHDQSGYNCSREYCFYCIHKKCAELPQHINHSLHALHHLTLTKRSSSSSSCCYYCEKPFENDECTYACDVCPNFHMHMTCATIPLPTILTSDDVGGGGQHHNVPQYACHQNPMILVEHEDERKGRANCFACHSLWSGPAYSCTSKECENFLHKSCADLQRKIKHPFHSRHPLILQVSKPRSCRSCCEKNCSLIFSCREDGCEFHLCPNCVSLDTIIVPCRSHDHLLPLVKNASCEIQCDACQKSFKSWVGAVPDEVNHTRSFLFRCMECVFNLHFLCGPLPITITYEYHIHPLILHDHLILEDDSDECYCDVCEEEVNLQFRIYYCEDCKYVAHIHCLTSEIMKAIKEDSKGGELKALGEDRWDEFDQTEAITEEEFMTLKHIMDKLTEEEKEMLLDPFKSAHPRNTTHRRRIHDFARKYLNSRFKRDGSIADIDRIQQYFSLERGNDYDFFCSELLTFTPDEGIKINDKYLRQKVENVDGYMVPKTLAPVLKTFIRKNNGDLGMKESLTPPMKSIAATLVCIVIDDMCRTKFEDVTWDDLKHWAFYLDSINHATGFRLHHLFLKEGPLEVLLHAFLGREAIRCRENGIRKLEADLERCKVLLEKHKGTDTSSASDFMKNECFKLASEFKGKDIGGLVFHM
ncbi:hypothetical protein TIFTF001_027381 [Ficus carica]|uniref:DC1 domain-containing protein n=1 Tax=Ficus carica TaxID=3494 RepID=A0AA88DN24_FICCA|nr:hypothetical protein TIFTF001_027381 [Ficus carica]